MPVRQQKIRAVLLGTDGVVLGDLQDLKALAIELDPALGALVLTDLAGQYYRRFLGQLIELFEGRIGNVTLYPDDLDDPRTVAHQKEADFSGAALVINPSAKRDGLTDMLEQVADQRDRRHFR